MLFSGLFSVACSVCSLRKARSTCPGAEALTYSVLVLLTSTTIQKIPYWLSDGSNFSSEVPSFQLTLVPVGLTKASHTVPCLLPVIYKVFMSVILSFCLLWRQSCDSDLQCLTETQRFSCNIAGV